MESNNYFDDLIKINDLDLITILLDKRSYQNVYVLSLIKQILENIRKYQKIRKYDRTKYLRLFNSDERYEGSFDRNRYLIMLKTIFQRRLFS